MFIRMSKEQILDLKSKNQAEEIARWDTLEGAERYYNDMNNNYTGYEASEEELTNAYSTPVKVFLLK